MSKLQNVNCYKTSMLQNINCYKTSIVTKHLLIHTVHELHNEKCKPPPTHWSNLHVEPRLRQEPVCGHHGWPRLLILLCSFMAPCLSICLFEIGWATGHPNSPYLFEGISCNISAMWCCMSCNVYVTYVTCFLTSHVRDITHCVTSHISQHWCFVQIDVFAVMLSDATFCGFFVVLGCVM
jgi:hypothetical protein